MDNVTGFKKDKKLGELGYINKNCWLVRNLNYPPTGRCQYCQLKFNKCLFFRYSVISFILIFFVFVAAGLTEGQISKLLILTTFVLIIIYGYFFNKSTETIILANFSQMKANEALEELTKHLQEKVDEQTKDLKRAYEVEKKSKEELQSLDRVKNQFLMTVQHHLRTPLTAMMGYADLLIKGTFGKPPKKIKEVIQRCQASTGGLIKMVNEFLDIAQFQLGKEVISLKNNIDLCPIFKDIIKELELETEEKGIYLKIEKPEKTCTIKADESKLKAALMNIFDNAVKYTDVGGVTIKLKVANDKVKIEIKDTGMGISKERLPKLFDMAFERTEEAKRNFATGRGDWALFIQPNYQSPQWKNLGGI